MINNRREGNEWEQVNGHCCFYIDLCVGGDGDDMYLFDWTYGGKMGLLFHYLYFHTSGWYGLIHQLVKCSVWTIGSQHCIYAHTQRVGMACNIWSWLIAAQPCLKRETRAFLPATQHQRKARWLERTRQALAFEPPGLNQCERVT